MPRQFTRRDTKDAWIRVCDHFPCGEAFTMAKAIEVGFPGVTRNNYSLYAKRLRECFNEVFERTKWEYPKDNPHVQCVRGHGESPMREVWVLPLAVEDGETKGGVL